MKYLKLYEAFKSEILSKTLSFISNDTKKHFLEKVESICKWVDFPMSELSDDFFQRMSFEKAVNLYVDENHKQGDLKWIKFWFDKMGNYLTTTGVDGTIIKSPKKESVEDYEIVKTLNLAQIQELETGDKVLIQLEPNEETVIATVFRCFETYYNRERVYMIQNEYSGTTPDSCGYEEWQKYGKYSWVITRESDFSGVPKLLKKKPDVSEEEKLNPYEYNFVLSTYDIPILIKRSQKETEQYLKTASFAIVLDLGTLKSSGYKTKSTIRTERETSREGALAFMTDDEIKSKNLQKYFLDIAKKIKFSEDLSNLKNLMLKVSGGNKIFMNVFRGNHYHIESIVNKVYSFLKLTKLPSQDEHVTDEIKNIIWQIEKIVKDEYEYSLKRNSSREIFISQFKKYLRDGRLKSQYRDYNIKVKLIFEILTKFEKLENDFVNEFRSLKIETLGDAEVVYYKLHSVRNFANNSQRFYTLKSTINYIIESQDVELLAHRQLSRDVTELQEASRQLTEFTPLVLKLLK